MERIWVVWLPVRLWENFQWKKRFWNALSLLPIPCYYFHARNVSPFCSKQKGNLWMLVKIPRTCGLPLIGKYWVAEKLIRAESRSWPVNNSLICVTEEITRTPEGWGLLNGQTANVIRSLLFFKFELENSVRKYCGPTESLFLHCGHFEVLLLHFIDRTLLLQHLFKEKINVSRRK